MQNSRKIHLTVNNFIRFENKVLFLQRALDKKWDPGKLNGVGGKVEPGEDFLQANIRETKEETGYELNEKTCKFFGIVRIETAEEEWIIVMFKSEVNSAEIPNGNQTEDGTFLWLSEEEVNGGKYEFVSDLEGYFREIFNDKSRIFRRLEV